VKKDSLFLLKRDFEDQAQPGIRFVCPECVFVEGLLSYYPYLRDHFDVLYVDFQRPRPEVIKLIGEENQSCPVLVLHGRPVQEVEDEMPVGHYGEVYFISGQEDIARYFSIALGVARLH
jgi:hypothetical protein